MPKFLIRIKKSPVYLLCGVVFLLFAYESIEDGGFLVYCVPAVICLAQYLYPTNIGWIAVFIPFLLGSSFYLYVIFKDVYAISTGSPPGVFLNTTDTIIFSGLILFVVALTIWLWKVRPVHEVPKSTGEEGRSK